MSTIVHPRHYNLHPSGIECMDVVERMDFCTGNAVKYLWRADYKDRRSEDIEKAGFYLDRILMEGSTVVLGGIKDDEALNRYAERLMEYGGWNAGIIWHIIRGLTERNPTHIACARNSIYNLSAHPQEIRNGPQARLRS